MATHPKTVIAVGKKLLSGHPGGAVKAVFGTGGKAAGAALGLAAVVAWVTGGARAALQTTAKLVDESARPNLESTWFSATYWRVAAVSALLTLPFLFAAAIQALLRSDMTLLARAAFGYLPLGMLAVGVAAPITMLLLAASDEMSAIVGSASGDAGGTFLGHVSILVAASNPFVAFFVALLTVAGAITLWLELLVREAAVYVIVLMLPLFFAALVWPARRIWAARAVELLIALILSKFAIVAVLQLGGAALQHAAALSITSLLAGLTLLLLAAFSPWALLRLLPLHELASAAGGGMRHVPTQRLSAAHEGGFALADAAVDVVGALPSRLQEMSQSARNGAAPERPALPPSPPDRASEPASEEHLEAAAEEAATAVAGSGGGSAATADPRPGRPRRRHQKAGRRRWATAMRALRGCGACARCGIPSGVTWNSGRTPTLTRPSQRSESPLRVRLPDRIPTRRPSLTRNPVRPPRNPTRTPNDRRASDVLLRSAGAARTLRWGPRRPGSRAGGRRVDGDRRS